MKRKLTAFALVLGLGLVLAAKNDDFDARRKEAYNLNRQGNFKEAFDVFNELAAKGRLAPNDVGIAVDNLRRLGRVNEVDTFRELAVSKHAEDWQVLQAVANSYLNFDPHHGHMVAGTFERGPKRGGSGKVVNAYERDRVRAWQLFVQALTVIEKKPEAVSKHQRQGFYANFSQVIMGNRGYANAWRLQYKTDLNKLPDYEDGWGWHHRYGRGGRQSQNFAPVKEDGTPVYHEIPKSFAEAVSDGERWRYLLMLRKELGASHAVTAEYARFLYNQFGVQTMQSYGWFRGYRGGDGDDGDKQSGIMQLHTLKDNETVARLATGVKRFTFPKEHDFMRLTKEIANRDEEACSRLAQVYLNRRQYENAAEQYRVLIKQYPTHTHYKQQLQQVVGNWGTFEGSKPQASEHGAKVGFRYRNGKKVTFSAYGVDVDKLLGDVKAYLKSNPKKLRWEEVDINGIGRRLVRENQKKYVKDKVAGWSLDLKPRPNHFDKLLTVTTPLRKAGAYLLTAEMEDGNVARTIVWLSDTVIMKKNVDGKHMYYVADAVTGKEVTDAKMEFFGYYQEWVGDRAMRKLTGRQYVIHTKAFERTTNADGLSYVVPSEHVFKVNDRTRNGSWLVIARKDGRLAYLGFEGMWAGRSYQQAYNQRKTFIITDRPVYRPGQKVKFKVWTSQVRYDVDDTSQYAGRSFTVRVNNPKGSKFLDKGYKADTYGGFDGEFELPKDATLGRYYMHLYNWGGGIQFRVEEYKKPEFEVLVESPTKPVMLGEKIPVTIKAKYYFGAPVAKGKVKVKVLRHDHDSRWYPTGVWDWFYGSGYWWFAYDYDWYPGWHHWGCRAPRWWWYPQRPQQPEVVVETESYINPDGTMKLEIDTALAKEVHGDTDHRYEVTAEVTDESRRVIVGTGSVIVARKPFNVHAWVDRGHYNVGDRIFASFNARTVDGKGVKGTGMLKLMKIVYDEKGKPSETAVRTWNLDTKEDGNATQDIQASEPGQYRLSYTVTDSEKHVIEGGYLFVVRGQGQDGSDFRFNKIELVPDTREYAPGDTLNLMINTDKRGATVLLFLRPVSGTYTEPKVIRMTGKSHVEKIPITKADMPNFFIEAVTVYDATVHWTNREIIVPPEKRVLNVNVEPSKTEYKPGEKAKVKVTLTDLTGEPFVGSVVMSIYDRAVEYVSGGPNVPEIKAFFWKWRRRHYPSTRHSLQRYFANLLQKGQVPMRFLGVFGRSVVDLEGGRGDVAQSGELSLEKEEMVMDVQSETAAAPMASMGARRESKSLAMDSKKSKGGGGGAPDGPKPVVRSKFADTAYWNGSITTDKTGKAEIELTMPENLTGWKVRTWAMGKGPRVGESTVQVVTKKNLMLRLQAPRFFVQKDEVVLSANVHNYLKTDKQVRVVLETSDVLKSMADNLTQTVTIPAGGEQRVDWRVTVTKEGTALVRMMAITDEESDAMEMRFPAKVHGFLKTESFSGHMRPEANGASVAFTVPKERRESDSRIEVRYSPTLAGAMVDALPYLVAYPYGCTEQTLNRFVPTVVTQKILQDMKIDLKQVREKRTNLNAQEIGDDKERAEQWKNKGWRIVGYDKKGKPIWQDNPVFDEAIVADMITVGITRLSNMQLSDGGWGWFSGWGEYSYPHTTATVVHGFQVAKQYDAKIPEGVLKRGVDWLVRYQNEQVRLIKRAPAQKRPYKLHADNLDALIFMVLLDADHADRDMQKFLYRDRNNLSVYGKCMTAIAFQKMGLKDETAMLQRNIEQFLVKDSENQTAYLKLPNQSYWWYWYGSEFEAHAYYLKLLARTEPKSDKAAWLVKYLLNNRKHATYWNSTRDTALCIEAMAEYMRASGETEPDMTLEVLLDGKRYKEVKINKENIFSFDNKFVLEGDAVTTGKHTLEFRRKGKGPLYFNAYVTYFSLEDFITKAGLEVKVNRNYFKLVRVDKTVKTTGSRGQAVDKKVEKYERVPLKNLDEVTSGDLLEIELVIDSKNDYEYVIFEDLKAAGCEPHRVRSGYVRDGLPAYMELRDDKVCFFVRHLARGRHSIAYRMRAEIPGKFSALPTKAYAMYAPELRGNSDEFKLKIKDLDLDALKKKD